jgi:UDP-GlcNAc:undecaprenyl-phosphate/decaprenyl-phosphate GlcNAc-1-phosphate transferase
MATNGVIGSPEAGSAQHLCALPTKASPDMPDLPAFAVSFTIALVASVALTPIVRAAARATGQVATPRADRWHSRPTALMGGIGIVFACLLSWAATEGAHAQGFGRPLVACACACALLGFVDDLRTLRPLTKLAGQALAASVLTAAGLSLSWTPWPLVNHAITVFWLVGVTNALNLLDNMDGLSGGVTAVAAAFQTYLLFAQGRYGEAALPAGIAGAAIGFLVYNVHPASIFMGDCGSLFLGFCLGGTALLQESHRSRGLLAVIAPPVLILAVPILDTTLVTVARKLHGRPVSQGGRDHLSHRLVALGLSERAAMAGLTALSVLTGLAALVAFHLPAELALPLLSPIFVGMVVGGLRLGHVRVYPQRATLTEEPTRSGVEPGMISITAQAISRPQEPGER